MMLHFYIPRGVRQDPKRDDARADPQTIAPKTRNHTP